MTDSVGTDSSGNSPHGGIYDALHRREWTDLLKVVLIVCFVAMLTACTSTPPSGNDAVCDALRPALPTWARADTPETKRQGANFLDVFEEVCGS